MVKLFICGFPSGGGSSTCPSLGIFDLPEQHVNYSPGTLKLPLFKLKPLQGTEAEWKLLLFLIPKSPLCITEHFISRFLSHVGVTSYICHTDERFALAVPVHVVEICVQFSCCSLTQVCFANDVYWRQCWLKFVQLLFCCLSVPTEWFSVFKMHTEMKNKQ